MAQNIAIDDPNQFVGIGPVFGTGFRIVPPPAIFQVGFGTDKSVLVFTIGDPLVTTTQRTKASYRVYFAPIALAGPTQINRPFVAYGVFQQSTMVGSVNAPQNGGTVTIRDSQFAGLDGWFFATAVNLFGIESAFVGPIRNPIVGTNDARVPPDVFDQTITLSDGGLDPWGRQLVNVLAEATVPTQGQAVASIQITAFGSGYTFRFVVTGTGGGGTGFSGLAILQDEQVIGVEITNPGDDNYTSAPTLDFSAGDGTGAAGTAFLTTVGSLSSYQLYILNYFLEPLVEGPFFANGSAVPGNVIHGTFLLEDDSVVGAHNVTFYFVSLSQVGTRRPDPTGAPSVVVVGGITPP